MKRHNIGHSKYTRKGVPWILVYYEEYPTRSEAVSREKHLKKQKNRKYLEQLIAKG
ncbi:MAG: GIY-YIG nuclease family protein [Bacteroidales bacterium]